MLTKGQKIWAVSLALCFLGGLFVGLWIHRPSPVDPPAPEAMKPDTVRIRDTVRIAGPPARPLRIRDTVWLAAQVPPDTSGHRTDTVYVPVPRRTDYYSGEGYEAWITGYEAQLDSLHLERITDIVERPVYKTVTKYARWGIGAQVGATYVRERGVVPYVGLGISYNLITF